jgi:crossover junction endodeoxyribonuclease RuvC
MAEGAEAVNVAGIDVGLVGAVAVVSEQDGFLFVEDLPVHHIAVGKKSRAELDLASLRRILVTNPIRHVVIERVAARPGQGVSSMFRFGYSAGSIYGLIVGLQLPVSYLLPVNWQRTAGVGPSPEAARQRAAQLYPLAASQLSRKRDAGRADAILIAHAGIRLLSHTQVAA